MQRVFALLAVLGVLVVPVFVSADGETEIPSEANWSAEPPTPPIVSVDQPRTVSTPQEHMGLRSVDPDESRVTGYLGHWDPSIPAGD